MKTSAVATDTGSFVCESGRTLNYLVMKTGEAEGRLLPMLVYLHGGDGRGTDPRRILEIESVPSYIADGKLNTGIPAIILAPQCPPGSGWNELAREVVELSSYAAGLYGADPDRISLTGCSLGGMGTFAAAEAAPEFFSCAVPVCASVDPESCRVLTRLPVWIFHGELDDGMGFSVAGANCVINSSGGRSRLTMLPGEGHEIRHVYLDRKGALVKWMLDRSRGEFPGSRRALFIGSSVCAGTGATGNRGWSRMLAERMNAAGWSTENLSIGGQTTSDILLRIEDDVVSRRPDLCVLGLGLANEGLAKTQTPEEAAAVRAVFDGNMRKLISVLRKAGIKTAAGGVYPSNRYNEFQYRELLAERRASGSWGVQVFQWLELLDDGKGHFREGLYHDAGHPSDEGYRVMFSAVPADFPDDPYFV